jgi:hypothetical protein
VAENYSRIAPKRTRHTRRRDGKKVQNT